MENDVTKLDQDNRSGVWRMATILLLSTWAKAATVRTLARSTVSGTARRRAQAGTAQRVPVLKPLRRSREGVRSPLHNQN